MEQTASAGTTIARRGAVLFVIAIASFATLATSAAYHEAQFERSGVATITVDAGSPRAVGTVVLDLGAAALPGPSAADPQPSGDVVFSLEPVATNGGYAPKGSDQTSSPAAQAVSTEPLSLSVTARNVARPAAPVPAGWSWPIEALCRVAEPCHREFDVTVEWLHPVTGGSRSAELRVALSLRYLNVDVVPAGTDGSITAGSFEAGPGRPAVSTTVDLGDEVLGLSAPFAARHVVLTASRELLDSIDSSAASVLVLAQSPAGQPGGPIDTGAPAIVTIVPDEGISSTFVASRPIGPGEPLLPFDTCDRGADCSRGFTIYALWRGIDPTATVPLSWTFAADARFGDTSSAVPAHATLSARIDRSLSASDSAPRLRASDQGSFDVPASSDGRGSAQLTVAGPHDASAWLGANPPAVALVTVRATGEGANREPLLLWVSSPFGGATQQIRLPIDSLDHQAVTYPLYGCSQEQPDAVCRGYLEITASSTDGHPAHIDWRLSMELPFPSAADTTGSLTVAPSGP